MKRLLAAILAAGCLALSGCVTKSASGDIPLGASGFAPAEETVSESDYNVGEQALEEDLIGYWEYVKWSDALLEEETKVVPWDYDYQLFAFDENGVCYSTMSDSPLNWTIDDFENGFDTLFCSKYKVEDGVITITDETLGTSEAWDVTVIEEGYTRKGVDFKPGDLLLHRRGPDGEVEYVRQLRRIEFPEES
ncbi:MAG: hypothetical protein DBX66_08355 [Clostridiales bacterium]|uniref:hypothetical protein n=1 Tax=Oscillospiraceae TaxID=216572 RepID=UPI0009A6ABAB|nr:MULTISPECIES: hypothetical protein [Oscillospiraceae]PWM35492.1 MAG: hypothetical protein DBX66_08355 [Clostridiales bacterium]RGB65163.1 hypothetical protein DW086_11055 [Harryflintia acetispora]